MHSGCQDHRSLTQTLTGLRLEKEGLYLLLYAIIYRKHLLNESQTHDMYCLWCIPILVVAAIL